MEKFLASVLRRIVHIGSLEVTYPSGHREVYGDGSGTPVAFRITSRAAVRSILLDPHLAVGEAVMDGGIEIERGSIYDFVEVLVSNAAARPHLTFAAKLFAGLRFMLRRLRQANSGSRSRRNVAHHYDLDGRLYRLFLDSDRQYSCAYFETPETTLEEAQLAKKRHIAAKLLVEKNHKVLDIGSGWGGMGLYLAQHAGANVTGVTLSKEQLAVSRGRAIELGLEDRARFELVDYRAVEGRFDRIVSVGMFEHVGVGFFRPFFEKAKSLLADDGVMLLHSIGRSDGPGYTNPWIDKYIFPGGYIPALSEVLPAIEKAGLVVTDIEILRLHYAETLKAWRERFLAHREEAKALYDERFCRMWDFYLSCSETAFRYDGMMIFQIQLARRQEAVPLTRGYIQEREAALLRAESSKPHLRLAGE